MGVAFFFLALGLMLRSASAQPLAQVTLGWTASPDTNVTGYFAYYGVVSGAYTVKTDVGNVTNAVVGGLSEGQTYYFVVTAYNDSGLESDPSNEASYFIPFSSATPTVTLLSPVSGTTARAPANIDLAASVIPNGHTIQKVQFLNGGTVVGETATEPYSLTWSNISAGNYSISARVTYDLNQTVNSSASTVVVTNPPCLISGFAKSSTGAPLASVTLSGFPGSPVTDNTGFYSVSVPYGWSGTVTAQRSGYSFNPSSRVFANVTGNQVSQDFSGTALTFVISGTARAADGSGLPGVILNGLPGAPMTDGSGFYSATVTYGWSGTVTPSRSGCTFSPASRSLSGIVADLGAQDFTASSAPAELAFVTGQTLGTWRTNLNAGSNSNAWQGMRFTVGSDDIMVTALGRWCAPGSSGSHTLKLVLAGARTDVPGSSVNLSLAGAAVAQFAYAALPSPVTLASNTTYYLVGTEGNGGDPWYDFNTSITNTPVARCQGAVYSFNGITWGLAGNTNNTYGPLDFKYATGAAPLTRSITGFARANDGTPLAGASLSLSGGAGTTITDLTGAYLIKVTNGWSGTVTVSKAGYTFSPANRTYSNVVGDVSAQNYTGSVMSLIVSGWVKSLAGVPLPGVVLGGLPGNPQTDINGFYSATITYGWSGSVTAAKNGYVFTPSSLSYSSLTSDQPNQNFTATLLTFAISGSVKNAAGAGVSGVALNGLPGAPLTDALGFYSATVPFGWSGVVSPTMAGYSLTPASLSYTNVSLDQPAQDYQGNLLTYLLSGSIKTSSGTAVSGVILNGLPGTPQTDGAGVYSAGVPFGWTGSVVPAKPGYTFGPTARNYPPAIGDLPTQDYTATLLTFVVSGFIKTSSGAPINGVTLDGLPSNPVTDSAGFFSSSVPYGWSGTVTAIKSGYSFTVGSRTYVDVTADQTGQDDTGTPLTFLVSGYVRLPGGAGVPGVSLGGLPVSTSTDSSGFYSATVNYGWSGTITPGKPGSSFSPVSRNIPSVFSDQAVPDFTNTVSLNEMVFVTSQSLGTWRTNLNAGNNLSAWQGMRLVVGSENLTVTALGRWCAPGSSTSHQLKLVLASTRTDVPGAAVNLSLAGLPSGQFAYAPLASPITLVSNTTYYLVGYDTNGSDPWYDYNTRISSTAAAQCLGGVYSFNGTVWGIVGTSNNAYGPVDFKYIPVGTPGPRTISGMVRGSEGTPMAGVTVSLSGGAGATTTDNTGSYALAVTNGWSGTVTANKAGYSFSPQSRIYANVLSDQPTQDFVGTLLPVELTFVTGQVLGTMRTNLNAGSNSNCWQGFRFLVGTQNVSVTALGRWCAQGASGNRIVKLVQADTRLDVPGTTVTISLAGTTNQFAYAPLPSPVTLTNGTAYFLATYDSNGGDPWYDYNTKLTTTSAAQCQSGVYSFDSSFWGSVGSTNNGYGPLTFKYLSQGAAQFTQNFLFAGAGTPPTPAIRLIAVKNGRVRLQVLGREGAGRVCRVQVSADLASWDELGTFTATKSGFIEFDEPMGKSTQFRFFRVL